MPKYIKLSTKENSVHDNEMPSFYTVWLGPSLFVYTNVESSVESDICVYMSKELALRIHNNIVRSLAYGLSNFRTDSDCNFCYVKYQQND